MIKQKYEKMAKECIKRCFHDCRFLHLVDPTDVQLLKGTNTILIKGKACDITATKTVKTVLNGKKKCVGCNAISKAAVVVVNIDTGKKNVIFLVNGSDGTFVPLTKDHIVAKARGGTDSYQNLQSMCSVCNSEKADMVVDSNIKDNEILIYRDHYESLITKQKDFSYTRKQIKKLMTSLPWYMRLLGVRKLIEQKLKEPLVEKGYYSIGKSVDTSDS